jgi:hypothetical protein
MYNKNPQDQWFEDEFYLVPKHRLGTVSQEEILDSNILFQQHQFLCFHKIIGL